MVKADARSATTAAQLRWLRISAFRDDFARYSGMISLGWAAPLLAQLGSAPLAFCTGSGCQHDGGLIAPLPRVPLVNHFTGLAESGMVQSFAASGFAAEPVAAAWLPSW